VARSELLKDVGVFPKVGRYFPMHTFVLHPAPFALALFTNAQHPGPNGSHLNSLEWVVCNQFSPTETTPCLSARNRKRGKLTSCDVKRQLLADYMTSLEHLKVAEQEHKEILISGTGDGVVSRSTLRIEALKSLSAAARSRYAEHCHAHRC